MGLNKKKKMSKAPTTEVDEKLKQYKEKQIEIQSLFSQKQKVLSQFNENTLVKGELDLIDEDTAVFKLVGPVLMSVETEEAKENVGKRLELIEEKLKMLDTAIAAKNVEQSALGDEIATIQQSMQAAAAQEARRMMEN